MLISRFALCAAMTLCTIGSALAGPNTFHLDNIQGSVIIEGNDGFAKAVNGDTVAANQKIILKSGSSAILQSKHGPCFFALRDAGVYNLPESGNCVPGQVVVLSGAFNVVAANGGTSPLVAPVAEIVPLVVAGGFLTVAATVMYLQEVASKQPVVGVSQP